MPQFLPLYKGPWRRPNMTPGLEEETCSFSPMPGTQWALAGTGTGILGAASHPWAPTPVQALGTSVGSPPLAACLQENFPADLGGQREGGAGLLPSNLDSWVYGRKRREADAVIKAIPEAVGGRQGAEPTRGCPHLCLPSCQKSQPQAGRQQAPRP